MGDAWLQAATVAEAQERLRRPPLRAAARAVAIHAAWEAVLEARPANEARALLARALERGRFDGRRRRFAAGTFATFVLIACEDLDAALRALRRA